MENKKEDKLKAVAWNPSADCLGLDTTRDTLVTVACYMNSIHVTIHGLSNGDLSVLATSLKEELARRLATEVSTQEQAVSADKESLRQELSDWIDTDNVANLVLEEMAEQDIPLTLENAQTIWLATLDNLWEEIRSACRHSDL